MTVNSGVVTSRTRLYIRLLILLVPVAVLLLSQTVFAQNTYMIRDGDLVVYHTSYATDPVTVLTEAGLLLGKEDTYTTVSGNGISEINVRRNYLVYIDNCGEKMEVSSRGETVEALLNRVGISVNNGISVSAPLSSQTYDEMQIILSRTVSRTEVYTVSVPHDVVYCNDASLPEGSTEILTPGVDGQMLHTANVVYVDGVEMSRTVLNQTVLQQPIQEVVAVGTGKASDTTDGFSGKLEIGDGYIVTETGEILTYSEVLKVKATAYTHTDEGCNEVTSTGTIVRVGTVAVDPKVIPYGTRMFIVSDDGKYVYGIATAEDCGGAIRENRVDLYYPTEAECWSFGRRNCTVYILGDSELHP